MPHKYLHIWSGWGIIVKVCRAIHVQNAGYDGYQRQHTDGMNRKVAVTPGISGDYVRRSDDGAHARRMK